MQCFLVIRLFNGRLHIGGMVYQIPQNMGGVGIKINPKSDKSRKSIISIQSVENVCCGHEM